MSTEQKALAAIARIRKQHGLSPMCCGCLIEGHPGDGWMQPPDPPSCCGEPDETLGMLLDGVEAELRRLQAENEGLHDAIIDELVENFRLRELGGARPDENITKFIERVIRERDELRAQVEAAKPVEWQARPTGAQEWRRIDPTREHPTVELRADYLRAFKNADGSNAYAVRALYTAPQPNGQ